ncbi:MAG TPA: hypothetical protein VMU57_06375 [Edaphobacter sp.]|uniref:hypothetical protein n=1 Tax=Edaphobacter sp. TaxID=1934404 RepID=UPI002CD5D6E1|nr:hypothetical protein [Edaphobacter sp.]HUZ94522.1 hypothetical protein [Edaphobacter sp.]
MNRTAADTLAAIVCPKREGIASSGNSWVFPVKVVRASLIADPILLRIPKGAGFEPNYVKTRASQALQENSACRANANDDIVDLIGFAEASHWQVNVLQRAKHVSFIGRSFKGAEDWFLHFDLGLEVWLF